MSLPQQLEVLLGDEQQQQQQQTDVGADRDGTDGEELASEWLDRVRHVACGSRRQLLQHMHPLLSLHLVWTLCRTRV